mmetsp:Transcript_7489/g.14633  ORF Transcript_7489/g.14633 Transcript_7489/m.14633 type:complete len:89 (-) Transcript_7489:289-555(-)
MPPEFRKQTKARLVLKGNGWWPGLDAPSKQARMRFWSLFFTTGFVAVAVLAPNNEDTGKDHIFSSVQRAFHQRRNQFFDLEDKGSRHV